MAAHKTNFKPSNTVAQAYLGSAALTLYFAVGLRCLCFVLQIADQVSLVKTLEEISARAVPTGLLHVIRAVSTFHLLMLQT